MKKNNTDPLVTLNFGRMCMANFLLYASVYLILPLMPAVAQQILQIPVDQSSWLYLAFVAGMVAAAPFYAYLGDAYKRKNVLMSAVLTVIVALAGMEFVQSFWQLWALVLLQGVGFGWAETAGLTLAIDVTASNRRSDGNKVFAVVGRSGMLVGAALSMVLSSLYDCMSLVLPAQLALLAVVLLVARVHVAFRAPIGLPVFSLDRFLLLRAWLPALNVAWLSGVAGMLLASWTVWSMPVVLVVLALLAGCMASLTKVFVRLSHHCQRGTANTTCQLAVDGGMLVGLCMAHQAERVGDTVIFGAVTGLLCFCLLTIPYYRNMRVR